MREKLFRRAIIALCGLALASACTPKSEWQEEARSIRAAERHSRHVPASSDASVQPSNGRAERPIPPFRGRERCPDETLARGPGDTDTLSVIMRDARPERRDLLPLDLLLALDSDRGSAREQRRKFEPSGGVVEPAPRYEGELVVEEYHAPHWFRRRNAPRAEWAAGALRGRLLVRDAQSGSVLCQAPVDVRGDAREAPISRRLRELTRRRLERALHARVVAESTHALASISAVLRIADAATELASVEPVR